MRAEIKVLFVPNETLGVNLVGMALSYYIRKEAGGQVDMVIADDAYKTMTEKNLIKMQQAHNFTIPYSISSSIKNFTPN